MSKWLDYYFEVTEKGVKPPIPEEKVQQFKESVDRLCKEYDITLLHEDVGGGFILQSGYDDVLMKWFNAARDNNAVRKYSLGTEELK